MGRGMDCEVHTHQGRVPQERHHIIPKKYGGPDTAENLIDLCANGHGDVHYYIALLFKYQGDPPPVIRRTFGRKVQAVAWRGYTGAKALHAANPAKVEAMRRLSVMTVKAEGL